MLSLFAPVPVRVPWRRWTPVRSLGVEVHVRFWTAAANPVTLTPLILIAGLGASSRYWTRLGRRLADDFHVLAPDLPGFGDTPRPACASPGYGPSVREQADHLIAWMDAEKIDRAVLCGHSVGCQVAVDVAVRFPRRVERLILLSPAADPAYRSMWKQVPRLIGCGLFEAPSLVATLVEDYLLAGPMRTFRQARRTLYDRVEEKLPLVAAPTLVVRGQYDLLVSPAWARKVAKLVPGAELMTIDAVGHGLHHSAASITSTLVRDFVRSVRVPDFLPPDDPQHDSAGPAQPISPDLHGAMDVARSLIAFILPRRQRWGRRATRLMTTAALLNLANVYATNSLGRRRSKWPMLTHTTLDTLSGVGLSAAAMITLRRRPRRERWGVAATGLLQILVATLTAKPTGPARRLRPPPAAHALPPNRR